MSVEGVRHARLELFRWGNSTMKDIRYPRKGERKDVQAGNAEFWLSHLGELVRRYYMAANVKTKVEPKKVEFKGFVNYVLSAEDKGRFAVWDVDDHDLWLLVAGDVSSGYKISVSYNPQNDTFNATYMCNRTDDPNSGYCLSAFAPDLYNAIKSLCFKHNVILEGVWNGAEAIKKDNWG